MARPLRFQDAGLWYHVTNRGNNRENVFVDDEDCQRFLDVLGASAALFGVEVHAYVIMTNHYHLFVRTPEANLSRFMQHVQVSFIAWYNRHHDRSGHVFQGRYKAQIVDRDGYGTAVSRYIHLNPVKVSGATGRTLQERRRHLRGYRWSSYRAYLGLSPKPEWLSLSDIHEKFGAEKDWRRGYAAYVEQGLLKDVEDPFEHVRGQAVMGSERFMERLQRLIRTHGVKDRNATGSVRQVSGMGIEEVVGAVAKAYGVKEEELRRARSSQREARQVALWLLARHSRGRLSGREIGEAMGGITTSAITHAKRLMEEKLRKSTAFQRRVAALQKSIFKS
ncbi:hypothetical protein GX586_07340 [bacterium]|nr:hypothetical protein [bacterium]